MNYQKYMQHFPEQTSALIHASATERLAHAYIIYGDNPEVLEEYSILLAQVASCPNSQNGVPCFQCSVCLQLHDSSFAELFSLMPNSKSRQIKIGENEYDLDTMRWFQYQFYMSSVSPGKRKIGIISDADCLTQQSQNAFLKTLEEPPSSSVFILNTSNPQALLPTIRSRCHIITILKNQYDYNFNGAGDVVQVLFRMQSCTSDHLGVGAESADKLISVSKALNAQAEAAVLPKWEERLEQADNPDLQWTAAQKKRIKERFEAAVASEYLRLRRIFISLIHTWFAQVYEISCGADLNTLPNPELYQHIDIVKSVPDEEKALKFLNRAEALIRNLNWNVNEELAIREFCCSFTA